MYAWLDSGRGSIAVYCGPHASGPLPHWCPPPASRAFGQWATGGARVHERRARIELYGPPLPTWIQSSINGPSFVTGTTNPTPSCCRWSPDCRCSTPASCWPRRRSGRARPTATATLSSWRRTNCYPSARRKELVPMYAWLDSGGGSITVDPTLVDRAPDVARQRRTRPGARVHERLAHSGLLPFPPPESSQAYMGKNWYSFSVGHDSDRVLAGHGGRPRKAFRMERSKLLERRTSDDTEKISAPYSEQISNASNHDSSRSAKKRIVDWPSGPWTIN